MFVPPRIVTNGDLATCLDTSDEWIRTRTGIRERRIAGDGETTSGMAVHAARAALASARVQPEDVDLVVVATSTPDHMAMPSTACLVQAALGLNNAAALDVNAACSGFVYGLATADSFVRSDASSCVLVIGSETFSRLLDWTDRATCVLFGDGAGAVVVQPSEGEQGMLAFSLGADGSGAGMLGVPAGGSTTPASHETIDRRLTYIKMEGKGVFRFSVDVLPRMIKAVLTKADLELGDVALIVAHQANARILQAAARSMALPVERFFMNLDRYGNTSAASIPIALAEALDTGRIREGDLVVLAGFGGGLTWGSAALRWGSNGAPERLDRRREA